MINYDKLIELVKNKKKFNCKKISSGYGDESDGIHNYTLILIKKLNITIKKIGHGYLSADKNNNVAEIINEENITIYDYDSYSHYLDFDTPEDMVITSKFILKCIDFCQKKNELMNEFNTYFK